jgi:hypothetical protein
MKAWILVLGLAASSAFAQLPANPSNITVNVGPGSTVTETVRANNQTRNVHVTRNPTDTLTVIDPPHMTHGLRVNKSTLAPLHAGYDTIRVADTTEVAPPSTTGAMRIACFVSSLKPDDPVVYPGKPGESHDHTVFGNNSFDAFQTAQSMLAAPRTACQGGKINMSNYWIPTLIDILEYKPIIPKGLIYYKTIFKHPVDPANPQPGETFIHDLPVGLKMVSGDPNATAPYSNPFVYRWNCRQPDGTNKFYQYIPTDPVICKPGANLDVEVFFPSCWDGTNLDSPNHKSHMAVALTLKLPNGTSYRSCPASHPKAIINISFSFHYVITDIRRMRLVSDTDLSKPGGPTMHGDVFTAWNDKYMKMWMDYCIRGRRDCHAHLIGRDPDDGKLKKIF